MATRGGDFTSVHQMGFSTLIEHFTVFDDNRRWSGRRHRI